MCVPKFGMYVSNFGTCIPKFGIDNEKVQKNNSTSQMIKKEISKNRPAAICFCGAVIIEY